MDHLEVLLKDQEGYGFSSPNNPTVSSCSISHLSMVTIRPSSGLKTNPKEVLVASSA